MPKTVFEIATTSGMQEVAGYIVGDLGIHKDYYWTVTHLRSGMRLAGGFDKLAEAKTFCSEIQKLFSFSFDKISDPQELYTTVQKLRRRQLSEK